MGQSYKRRMSAFVLSIKKEAHLNEPLSNSGLLEKSKVFQVQQQLQNH